MKKDVPLATSLPNGIYTIQDNGLRCFVPPCFSWNVFDTNNKLIAQVSDIDFSFLQSTFDLEGLQVCLVNKGLKVRGYTVSGVESDGVRQAIKFIVESLENSHRQRK
jgi:hypothetical protein